MQSFLIRMITFEKEFHKSTEGKELSFNDKIPLCMFVPVLHILTLFSKYSFSKCLEKFNSIFFTCFTAINVPVPTS